MEASTSLNQKNADFAPGLTKTEYIRMNKFSKIISECLSTSSIPTLYDIYRVQDYFIKTLLLAFFLASCAICGFLTAKTFMDYLSHNVLTSSSIISDIPVEFPVIGICNLNPFDYNYATEAVEKFAYDGTINETNETYTANDYINEVTDYFTSNLINSNIKNLSGLTIVGFLPDQLILSCRFQNRNCSADDFILQYDFNYGLCSRFNTGKTRNGTNSAIETSGQVGWKFGLKLELYAGHAQLQEKFAATRGFRILIFNRSEVSPDALETGIEISTGQSTNIGMRRTFTNHLPSPYSNCLPTDITKIDWNQNKHLKFMYDYYVKDNYYESYYNWRWNWTVTYSQSICVKLCFVHHQYDYCGCLEITAPHSPSMDELFARNSCVTTNQIECMEAYELKFFKDTNLVGECYTACPNECTEVNYGLTISSSSFPTEWYANVLSRNKRFMWTINSYFSLANVPFINYTNDYAALKSSVARVNIFYDDLRYTSVDESPAMSLVTLLGTLGGNLGLFLGASILSFAEPIKMVYECVKECLRYAGLRKIKNKAQKLFL